MHFLTLQAYHARLIPVDRPQATAGVVGEEPLKKAQTSEHLMYLGHADGFAIVYDFCTQRTWRVPEDKVMIQIDPVSIQKPRKCFNSH